MIVYSDLDGTMLGPGGSLIRAADRSWTLEPAQALISLHSQGIPLMLVSGRTRAQLMEAAALTSADGFIAEMGALLSWDHGRQTEVLSGAAPPPLHRAPDEVVAQLLEQFDGQLDVYDPWHEGHEVDILMRGRLDPLAVESWLAEKGFSWLRLRDNGVIPEAAAGAKLRGSGPVHVLHLMPDGISKGLAVKRDLERRGLDPATAVAVGDSASDLTMAPHVGRFFLVANGAAHPHMAPLIEQHENLTITAGMNGAGFVEAVKHLLAEV